MALLVRSVMQNVLCVQPQIIVHVLHVQLVTSLIQLMILLVLVSVILLVLGLNMETVPIICVMLVMQNVVCVQDQQILNVLLVMMEIS